jgi:hypothetical protein
MGNAGVGVCESGATIAVVLDQGGSVAYVPGTPITGKVYLSVTNNEGVPCNSVSTKLLGQEHTTVHYTTDVAVSSGSSSIPSPHKTSLHKKQTSQHTTAHDCNSFLDTSLRVANVQSGVIERGQYEYPISFVIPPGSPATIVVGSTKQTMAQKFSGEGSSGRVCYTLHVWLDRPGVSSWDKNDVKSEIQLTIKVPAPMQQSIPRWIEPADGVIDIKTCFCYSRGAVLAGAVAESAVLSKGSTFWINYALENMTTSRIKAIEITLTQTAECSAAFHSHSNSLVVFHTRMTPEQAGLDLKAPKPEKHSALGRMLETLQSGKLQRRFDLGANASESYQGSSIKVTHTLTLKICTPFGTASPTIQCPIRICSETGVTVPNAEPSAQTPQPTLPAGWAPVVAQAVVYPAMQLWPWRHRGYSVNAPVLVHAWGMSGMGLDGLMQTLTNNLCYDPCGEVELWLKSSPSNSNSVDDLSPDNLYDLFSAVKDSFDKTRLASLVAEAHTNAFRCAHISAACRGCPDFIRREVAECLLSHAACTGEQQAVADKENCKLIEARLTSFQFRTLERHFK